MFDQFRKEANPENSTETYEKFVKLRTTVKRFGGNFQLMQMILEGLFGFYLQEWRRTFEAQNILVVDGSKLNSNASVEISRIQSFLELPELIKADNFTFNTERHLQCLKGRQGQ